MSAKVTIIVPAYHQTALSVQLTIQCLTNITKYTDPELYELIVIEDIPKHRLRDDFNVFQIKEHIILSEHTNYAKKVNIAAKMANTPYIAVIQNDCFVWEGWLETFLYYFDKGMSQAMVPSQFARSRDQMKIGYEASLDDGMDGGVKDACMIFVTKKAFDRVKGFNEDLDAFVERDFYGRLDAKNIKVHTTSKVHVTHVALGTHYQNVKKLDQKTHHDGQIENHGFKLGELSRERKPSVNNSILITGGTGSLGQALLKRLSGDYKIRVFSRSEAAQLELKDKYPSVEFVLGDVRDKYALKKALVGIDTVIHAAAFKFLPQAEAQSRECVYTNVVGSLNLIEAVEEIGTVSQVLGISTDKVVYARNVYGCTKHIMEKLFKEANANSSTTYSCVRYGNVLGTTGAVHTVWKKQKAAGQPLTVTDKRMRRFFFPVDEAVDLVFYALDNMHGGEIFAVKMPSYSIYEMATKLSKNVVEIGLRPGEKLNETLIGDYEGKQFTSKQSGNNEVVII